MKNVDPFESFTVSDQPMLKFKRLHPDAKAPTYATAGSAGMDVSLLEDITFHGTGMFIARTGLQVEIPAGYELQVRPRSGLALKYGITILNSPGTIDSDFRGEVKVLLARYIEGFPSVTLRKGERIAQLVLAKVERLTMVEAPELGETERGEGGFGSTGK